MSRSIVSEVKRQSFALAILVSIVIFLVSVFFLFSFKVQQQQYAISKKIEIDSNLILKSLEIGDLFFITQYLDTFVKSGVVDFVGVHESGGRDWIAISPRSTQLSTAPKHDYMLNPDGIHLNGSWPLRSSNGSWDLRYNYRISYKVFLWPLLLSIVVAIIIFLITKNLLRSAARRISRPIESLSMDLDNQEVLASKKLQLQEYSKGVRFRETDSFVVTLQGFITKLAEQQEKLKDIEVYKALNRISRQVNHDIQSPVGALKAAVNSLPPEQGAQKALIEKAVKRIQAIAADLEITNMKNKNDVGKHSSKVDLKPLVQELVQEKATEFKTKSVKFNINFNLEKLKWDIDPHEFGRAVSNIINNGIEAADSGKAEIQILLAEENGIKYIEIQDNGKGIPEELEKSIFDYGFTRGKEKGTGLGLHYAQTIIERSGAQLTYKKLTKGSGFRISFPQRG